MNTTESTNNGITIIENHDNKLWSIIGDNISITDITFDKLKTLAWELDVAIEDKLRSDELSQCCSATIDTDTGRCMDCREGCR